jgi:hypothetical protein
MSCLVALYLGHGAIDAALQGGLNLVTMIGAPKRYVMHSLCERRLR